MADPYPKTHQLRHYGEPRRHRKRVGRADWFNLRKQKLGPCRVCNDLQGLPGSLHHIVPRSLGGDDVADNLLPLCGTGTTGCHGLVEALAPLALKVLRERLEDDEYAYAVEKLGPWAMERLFGVRA